jgi:flavin-dependent dehydrogenase
VLVLDGRRRGKICGGGLTAESLRLLDGLGLADAVRRIAHRTAGLSVFSASGTEVRVCGTFLTVERAAFDATLAQAAVEAGAVFHQACVDAVEPLTDGTVRLELAACPRPVRARFAVLATGASARLARGLGMMDARRPSAVAVRCIVRSNYSLDRMVAAYLPDLLPGYGWVFPLGDGAYNIGCAAFEPWRGTNLAAAFQRFTRQLPVAEELVGAAEAIPPLEGGILRCGFRGMRRLVVDRVVAVGETVGSTLPLTGEGIGMALATAGMAAEALESALASDDPAELRAYPARVARELRPRHLGLRLAQRAASVRWVNDLVARQAQEGRWLHATVAAAVTDQPPPAAVRGLRRLIRWLAGP